jgi:excisionase family DNA binding protein
MIMSHPTAERNRKLQVPISTGNPSTLSINLTPEETMDITRFGRSSTYAMLRGGIIPSIRVGKRFFIPRHALMRWLESCGQA